MENGEDIKLLMTHDKDIGLMSQSIEHLANAVKDTNYQIGTTNRKIEDIIEVISTANVIAEKVSNMDSQLKESFDRVHDEIADIKSTQSVEGCAVLKVQASTIVANARELKWAKAEIETLKADAKKHLPSWATKWLLAVGVLQSIAFGTYVVSSLHDNELETRELKTAFENHKGIADAEMRKQYSLINRNYGHILGSKGK